MNSNVRLPNGKFPVDLLADMLAVLPLPPPELRLGPRIGEDACAIEVPALASYFWPPNLVEFLASVFEVSRLAPCLAKSDASSAREATPSFR